jgi:hypothetical protein
VTSGHFRDRFALQRLEDGGVIVDLSTGAYSRLNRSAVAVCEALTAAPDSQAAVAIVSAQLGIRDVEASHAIEEMLTGLHAPPPRQQRPDPFHYKISPEQDGYILSSNDKPVLWMTSDGQSVRLLSQQIAERSRLGGFLRAAAPRLLFLQGAAVLHGAACRTAGGVIAICGDSGAGKTTTARALEAAGADLIAEDMLVLAQASPALEVHEGGEESIKEWSLATTDRLLTGGRSETSDLRAVFDGSTVTVTELWFISATQRAEGESILRRRLGPTDGALVAMASLFLGEVSSPGWRRFLDLAGAIASSTAIYEAQMPLGLEYLRKAARTYNESWT